MTFADVFFLIAVLFAAMLVLVPLVAKPTGPAGAAGGH